MHLSSMTPTAPYFVLSRTRHHIVHLLLILCSSYSTFSKTCPPRPVHIRPRCLCINTFSSLTGSHNLEARYKTHLGFHFSFSTHFTHGGSPRLLQHPTNAPLDPHIALLPPMQASCNTLFSRTKVVVLMSNDDPPS
jgi:hypothetical protein